MAKKEAAETAIRNSIMRIMREKNPESVEQLVQLVRLEHPILDRKIIECILRLQNERKIIFKEPPTQPPSAAGKYLFSSKAIWYWIIIALSFVTTITVFTVPEDAFPIVYARYAFGSVFVLFLPGYCFIKALFPKKELEDVERVALSLGMSLALVPVTGLLLNYTPWGIKATPIILSLLVLTVAFATTAILREYWALTSS